MFKDLPLNTSSIYVMEVAKSGCKIYIPVAKEEQYVAKKKQLRNFLDNQPEPLSNVIA